jgi:hypothetical protein
MAEISTRQILYRLSKDLAADYVGKTISEEAEIG